MLIPCPVLEHFKDIKHDPKIQDKTYENAQARYRTMILMDKANQLKGLVVGTGDLSELALGWNTFSGDQIFHYGVNVGVPKTLVKYLVGWVADTEVDKKSQKVLKDILATPISPELVKVQLRSGLGAKKGRTLAGSDFMQKTEEIIGPYELHDFFLYHFLRWGSTPAKILFLAGLAFKKSGRLTTSLRGSEATEAIPVVSRVELSKGHINTRLLRSFQSLAMTETEFLDSLTSKGNYYSETEIKKWLKVFLERFFANQWKRSVMPDGPKVGSVALSPRGDWRMPSDAEVKIWLDDLK